MKNAPKADELSWRDKYQGLLINAGDRDRLVADGGGFLNGVIGINKNAAPV